MLNLSRNGGDPPFLPPQLRKITAKHDIQIKSQPTNQIATNKSKSNQLLARLAFEEIPA
jgi:hypothetical protein